MTASAADTGYAAFAARLRASGLLTDPWLAGTPRFREAPVVLDAATHDELARAAEGVAAAYNRMALLVRKDPSLLDGFFGLSPWQKLMWLAQAPLWHGIARADVFRTAEGPRICEINSDTPSGQAESVVLGRLAADAHPGLRDPNHDLETRFCALLEAVAPRTRRRRERLSVGVVYPTELPEDLSMIALYREWFERRGWTATLGSPFNLGRAADGRATLFGRACDVVVRHYKTDWWGERRPAWDDAAPFPDPDPLDRQLAALLEGALAGRTAVVNPFGAVVTQNKKSLAFLWERIGLFPAAEQAAIRAHVPPTYRLSSMDAARLRDERERWVLKSDYGCESDEVVVGAACTAEEWAASLEHAIPSRWIVQERFVPLADADGTVVNHGVWLVAGCAAGVYARVQRSAAGEDAVSAPVLVGAPNS